MIQIQEYSRKYEAKAVKLLQQLWPETSCEVFKTTLTANNVDNVIKNTAS